MNDDERTTVVEVPQMIIHPAVDPKPIAYTVPLNPGETPTDYDVGNGIPGDDSWEGCGLGKDPSLGDMIEILEQEMRYAVPGTENGDYQKDYVVECWHRRDRLWVVFTNHRRPTNPDKGWDGYYNPEHICNYSEETCDSCLMGGLLALKEQHGEAATKSFVDYWLWEDKELKKGIDNFVPFDE